MVGDGTSTCSAVASKDDFNRLRQHLQLDRVVQVCDFSECFSAQAQENIDNSGPSIIGHQYGSGIVWHSESERRFYYNDHAFNSLHDCNLRS